MKEKISFVKKKGWMREVVDHGAMVVTYANGKTESVRHRTIQLMVFVAKLPAFEYEFHLCHIPNNCDFMLEVPWKRLAKPIIDWETDPILSRDAFIQETVCSAEETWKSEEISRKPLDVSPEKRFYYSKRFGFTKHVPLKQADKLIRKQDVEFTAVH
ncbi:hypothetical protein PHMEG_00016956 [Phytophthora megakarya]|uniref:Uncharacterized protein n=1 Tax=Phytophthora megakarya TaxID=4795 RepID=A0A225W040_9STRA|nr:hypothetical protein PHMEG_00016956 [Phytophthora megakarya]